MPPLIRFILKWTLVGVVAGLAFMGAIVLFDVGEVGTRLAHSSNAGLATFIMAASFAVTFAQLSVFLAVTLRDDFGGKGSGNSRLERWKAGGSAEIDQDRPLP